MTLYTLEWLFLTKTTLVTLPKDLWRLQNLKIIDLAHNKLNKIPSSLGKMEHLERLHLGESYCVTHTSPQ